MTRGAHVPVWDWGFCGWDCMNPWSILWDSFHTASLMRVIMVPPLDKGEVAFLQEACSRLSHELPSSRNSARSQSGYTFIFQLDSSQDFPTHDDENEKTINVPEVETATSLLGSLLRGSANDVSAARQSRVLLGPALANKHTTRIFVMEGGGNKD